MDSIPLRCCTRCRQELPATPEYFSPRKAQSGRLYFQCRKCVNARRRELHKNSLLKLPPHPDGHKQCGKCKEIKPFSAFSRDSTTSTGYRSYCKDCERYKRNQPAPPEDVSSGFKYCTSCKEFKPLERFWFNKKKRHYFYECNDCKNARNKRRTAKNPEYYREQAIRGRERRKDRTPRIQRRAHLKMKYGISEQDYDAMFLAQFGFCAICGRAPKNGSLLVVDHCHITGKVRALLCNSCNQMLGQSHDDPDVLRKGADYIEKHMR